jgi:hypothetical protein
MLASPISLWPLCERRTRRYVAWSSSLLGVAAFTSSRLRALSLSKPEASGASEGGTSGTW